MSLAVVRAAAPLARNLLVGAVVSAHRVTVAAVHQSDDGLGSVALCTTTRLNKVGFFSYNA